MELNYLQFIFIYAAILEFCESSINLALHKATKRNSLDTNTCYKASNAVDGNIRNQVDGCCCCSLPPYVPLEAWLEVDLFNISRIQKIEVFHRRMWMQRSVGYHIFVSNTTELIDELYHKDTNPGGPPLVQNITGRTTARYVTLYNNFTGYNGNTDMAVLDLCEVKIYGCPLGKYGIRCEQQCSVGCKQGYFCEPDNGQCVGGCESEWTGQNCNECIDGKHGVNCDRNCYVGCLNGTCDQQTAECDCKENWIGLNCSECRNGYFGYLCDMNCSMGCINETCDKESAFCSYGCKTNWNGEKCDGCKPGLYGEYCEHNCSVGCLDNICNRTNGECSCKDGFIGEQCYECRNGYFGYLCDMNCSMGCINETCDKESAFCSYECKTNWNGEKCDGCKPGLYGEYCEYNCSVGCLDIICNRTNGECSCKDGFIGEKCYGCKPGLYGEYCEHNCSVGCLDNICNRTNGECSCKDGFIGEQCYECRNGYHGYLCDGNCSIGCYNQSCDKETADCIHGCEANFNGSKCDECADGLYGEYCENQCSVGCLHGTCDRSGTCTGGCKVEFEGRLCDECVDGRYGTYCDKNCSIGCLNVTCEKVSAYCIYGCNENWDGSTCTDCEDGWDGPLCSVCIGGKYGKYCNQTCGNGCINKECERLSGNCSHGCQDNYHGPSCQEFLEDTSNPEPWVIGAAVGIISAVAIMIILVVVVWRRRQNSKSKEQREGRSSILNMKEIPTSKTYQTPRKLVKSTRNEKKPKGEDGDTDLYANITNGYYNQDISSIAVTELREYLSRKSKQDFQDEYMKIPENALHPYSIADKPENKVRNRFKRVYCYDHSRITLDSTTGQPNSDYINANYIDGVEQRRVYIATQGPKCNTTDDFWRMVWQVKSSIIVMLANLVENGKIKCEKYWPEIDETKTTGGMNVVTDTVQEYMGFIVRKFRVFLNKTGESRIVFHFHFTSWPDHGTPDLMELIQFHGKISSTKSTAPGPCIVHCSAGVGRTGTFIALDALLIYGKATGFVNIMDYVKTMRENRMNMIQNVDQYIFLHEVLVEAFLHKETSCQKDNFTALFRAPSKLNSIQQQEYEELQAVKPVYLDKDYKTALQMENKTRNKDNCPLALEKYRQYIIPRTSFDSNYINGVTIPSHNQRKGYIITHVPLPNTVVDLWSVVYDQDCRILVLLDIDEQKQRCEWFPSKQKQIVVGPFTVENEFVENKDSDMKESTLSLTEQGSRKMTVKVFMLSSWKHRKLPQSIGNFLKLLHCIDDSIGSKDTDVITVICPDGVTCCGLFCAVRNMISSLRRDDEVDIFHTVRQIQVRRPECISSIDQYKFCYEAVNEFLGSENVYAN